MKKGKLLMAFAAIALVLTGCNSYKVTIGDIEDNIAHVEEIGRAHV